MGEKGRNASYYYDWEGSYFPSGTFLFFDNSIISPKVKRAHYVDSAIGAVRKLGSFAYTTPQILGELEAYWQDVLRDPFEKTPPDWIEKLGALHSLMATRVVPSDYYSISHPMVRKNFREENDDEEHEPDLELINAAIAFGIANLRKVALCSMDGGLCKAYAKTISQLKRDYSDLFYINHFETFEPARNRWARELSKRGSAHCPA